MSTLLEPRLSGLATLLENKGLTKYANSVKSLVLPAKVASSRDILDRLESAFEKLPIHDAAFRKADKLTYLHFRDAEDSALRDNLGRIAVPNAAAVKDLISKCRILRKQGVLFSAADRVYLKDMANLFEK